MLLKDCLLGGEGGVTKCLIFVFFQSIELKILSFQKEESFVYLGHI